LDKKFSKMGVMNSIVFHPPNPKFSKIIDEIIWLDCKNDTNEVVSIPSLFFKNKNSKKCILLSHGNATDISQMYLFLDMLSKNLEVLSILKIRLMFLDTNILDME
jgi:cobalamin biosynthesis Co2+ chelatase CbiK